MTSRLAVTGGTTLALGIIGLAATTLHAREQRAPLPVSLERLMYLRSGSAASRVFLSFDAIAADVYWIRAIQHYGRERKSPRADRRFELLQPLLDLTTTLDTHFNRAYRFGAIFLAMDPPEGPGRADQAIALLEKGLEHNPTRWQYAQDIGFIHYWFTGNYREAAAWFERAADVPHAPEWLRPMAGVARAKGGDRAGARQVLGQLLASDERYIRDAGSRLLAQLNSVEAIEELTRRVGEAHAKLGRYPADWKDMVSLGLLPGTPVDPAGAPFMYDAGTHLVTLSPKSSLAPLPAGLVQK